MATEAVVPDVIGSAPIEAPEVSAPESTPEIPGVEQPVSQPEQPTAEPQPAKEGAEQDSRKMSPALRKMVADLSAKPETQALAKQLKGVFFSEQAYRAVFPTTKEAQDAKAFVDQVGGAEGLEAIEAERGEWAALDEQYSTGDPKFIENIAAENPEAFAAMVPHALEQLEKLDGALYTHIGARIIANTVNQRGGLRDLLQNARNQASNPQELSKALNQIEGWFNFFDEKAQKLPEKKVDPERQRLEADRQAFEEQKSTEFRKGVQSAILDHTKGEIKRLLSSHLGGKTISDEDFAAFHDNVVNRVRGLMLADKAYAKKGARLLEAFDREGALKFQREKLAQLLPDAVAKTYRLFYSIGSGGKAAPKPAAQPAGKTQAAAPQGWARVSGPPNVNEVDHNRTSMDMKYNGQAVLKSGKRVYWGDKVPA